jgi:uncharacterized protein YbjT (DUF2867 family)
MTTILITGATGNIGSQLARELLAGAEKDVEIRVATREPARLADLEARGAAVVRLDLDDDESVAAALAGVDRLFLVGPAGERFGDRVGTIAGLAAAAGVEHLVRLSGLGANPEAAFPLAREHGSADRHLAGAEIGWTILRPTFFQDNVINFGGATIQDHGAFYGASGAGKAAYISSADIARVAAAVLLDPAAHRGQILELTGPSAVAAADIAAVLTEVIGREIRYVDLDPAALTASLGEAGMPAWLVESLVGLEEVKRRGWAEAARPAVKEITGREPESLRDFLVRNRSRLL